MFDRIKKVILSLFGGRAIGLLRNVLVIPILIRFWGLEYYGEWIMISTIPSVLSMTNVGLGTAGQISIVSKLSNKDISGASNILSHTVLLTFLFFFLIIGGMIIVDLFYPITFKQIQNGILVIVLLTTSYFINLISKSLRGFWIYNSLYARSANFDNILGLFELLVLVLCPILGYGALFLSISNIIVNILWTLFYYITTVNTFNVKIYLSTDLKIFKELMNKGIGYQFSALWQAILFQSPMWIIGLYMSPAYVGLWGSLRAFTRLGNQIIEIISLSVGSEFQKLSSDKKSDKILQLLFNFLGISMIVSVLGCLLVIFGGDLTYNLWSKVDSKYDIDSSIWIFQGVGLIFFSIWRLASEVEIAYNKPWKMNIIGIIISILSCSIIFLFIPKLGLISAAIGSLLFDILMSVFIPYIVFKRLGINNINDFKVQISSVKLLFKRN